MYSDHNAALPPSFFCYDIFLLKKGKSGMTNPTMMTTTTTFSDLQETCFLDLMEQEAVILELYKSTEQKKKISEQMKIN